MNFSIKCLIGSLFLFLSIYSSRAQDIEKIIKAPPLATNGGLSISQIGHFSNDTTKKDQLYSIYVAGNLNTTLWGIVKLPISFAYTNNKVTSKLPQPFNRFSLSPSYKWISTYIGYSSMSFSQYTLSGHEFMGGGIALKPIDCFKFSAMFGRLKTAIEPDTLNTEPSYYRLGGGFKTEYFNKYFDLSLNIFKAKDDPHSIDINKMDSIVIAPKDNLTGSISIKIKPYKNLTISGEYAVSALNQNINGYDTIPETKDQNLIINNANLSIFNAYKTSISQKTKLGNIGATFEHIDPNYSTLGTYYSNNDFENITADFSTSIKKRLTFSLNVGYQHDNLNEQKTNSSNRIIYSLNTNLKLTKKLIINGSFSNIQTYVHINDIYDQLTQTNQYQNTDSLSFTQINQTESANINYVLQSSKQRRQNININFSYQKASQEQSDETTYTGNHIYNSTISYQYSLLPQRFNSSININHNYNITSDNNINVWSFNLSLQKVFWSVLKTSLVSTYSTSYNQEESLANIINLRLNSGYTYKKRHTINLSLATVKSMSKSKNLTQININLSYNYIFNFQVEKEKKKLKFKGNF